MIFRQKTTKNFATNTHHKYQNYTNATSYILQNQTAYVVTNAIVVSSS